MRSPDCGSENWCTLPISWVYMVQLWVEIILDESLAEEAEFFSFGNNNLTRAAFPFSREDAENKFPPKLNQHNILQDNPFMVLDIKAVGQLTR